jgi:hypothetical protein
VDFWALSRQARTLRCPSTGRDGGSARLNLACCRSGACRCRRQIVGTALSAASRIALGHFRIQRCVSRSVGVRPSPVISASLLPRRRSRLPPSSILESLARDDAATFGPGMILLCHVADTIRMLRSEVMHLGAVDLHVVEFPRSWIFALPFADTDRDMLKRGFARSFRLRRGQEDQRSQAAYSGRPTGPPSGS